MSDGEESEYLRLVNQYGEKYGGNPELAKKEFDELIFSLIATYLIITVLVVGLLIYCTIALFQGRNDYLFFVVMLGAFSYFAIVPFLTKNNKEDSVEVFPTDCPELFRRCDLVADQIGVSRVKRIYLDHAYNAGAGNHSDWLWKKPEPYLLFGGHLLAAGSPDEVDSVIAHELAHHLASDGLEAYRLSFASLLPRNYAAFLPFLKKWIWNAHAIYLVLSRTKERSADALARSTISDNGLARHFVRSHLWNWTFEPKVKSNLAQWTLQSEQPIADYYKRLSQIAMAGYAEKPELLKALLNRDTSHSDTHPSLSERLLEAGINFGGESDKRINEWANQASQPLSETGITVHLGGVDSTATKKLNELWQKEVKGRWRMQRQISLQSKEILARLGTEVANLTALECDEVAMALNSLHGQEESINFLVTARKKYPEDRDLLKALAQLRFEVDPLNVIWLIDEMLMIPGLNADARELQASYAWHFGKSKEYLDRRKQFVKSAREEAKLRTSISGFTLKTDLKPHKLKEFQLNSWVDAAKTFPEVEQMYACNREHPTCDWLAIDSVICIVKPNSFNLSKEKLEDRLAREIRKASGMSSETEFYIFAKNHSLAMWLRKKHPDKIVWKK